MKRFFALTTLMLLALLIAACGGATDTATDTPTETESPAIDADDIQSGQAPVETNEPEANVSDTSNVALPDTDPASLEPGTYHVEVTNRHGTKVLELMPPTEDSTEYMGVSYNIVTELQHRAVSFDWVWQDGAGSARSQVILYLPLDVTAGTHPIEGYMYDFFGEPRVGASVSAFADAMDFYTQYEGTIVITAVTDETISGTFAFTARGEDGIISTVTGVFNQIAS